MLLFANPLHPRLPSAKSGNDPITAARFLHLIVLISAQAERS
jgi:hypothetical protein